MRYWNLWWPVKQEAEQSWGEEPRKETNEWAPFCPIIVDVTVVYNLVSLRRFNKLINRWCAYAHNLFNSGGFLWQKPTLQPPLHFMQIHAAGGGVSWRHQLHRLSNPTDLIGFFHSLTFGGGNSGSSWSLYCLLTARWLHLCKWAGWRHHRQGVAPLNRFWLCFNTWLCNNYEIDFINRHWNAERLNLCQCDDVIDVKRMKTRGIQLINQRQIERRWIGAGEDKWRHQRRPSNRSINGIDWKAKRKSALNRPYSTIWLNWIFQCEHDNNGRP